MAASCQRQNTTDLTTRGAFVELASAQLRPIVSKPLRHLRHKGYKSLDITSISIWRGCCFHIRRQ